MCRHPFVTAWGHEYRCGKCMACRVFRRREWIGRLLLEASSHSEGMFVTLTYDDEHEPADGVSVLELQKFLKRFRKNVEPKKIRFYGVGEYGSRLFRPHYHVALFGSADVDACGRAWTNGFIHYGCIERGSVGYLCSHVAKGIRGRDADHRAQGRLPEFVRMSLRPGIGALALEEWIQWLTSNQGSKWLAESSDVPTAMRADGSSWPMGRYLTSRMRMGVGWQKTLPLEVSVDLALHKWADRLSLGPSEWNQKRTELRIRDERAAQHKLRNVERNFL